MAYARRDVVGGAIITTLSAGITSGDTSFTIASATGWPTGSNGDFFVVLDRGNAGEEKVRCSSRTGTTCTVQASGRGSDGTSAAAHSSGVTAEHCLTALDLDEANYAVAKTVGLVAAQGDILVGSAANTLVKLAKGTSGLPLVAGASTVSYAAIGTAAITDANVTLAKLAAEAWSTWAPTVTSQTGTITTVGTVTARAAKIGRTVVYRATIPITTNGTGATGVNFTLPYTPVNATGAECLGYGLNASTAGALTVVINSTSGYIRRYDSAYPITGDGQSLSVAGTYESTS